jgi:RimJ/RimL family protein N-acetyltransferase
LLQGEKVKLRLIEKEEIMYLMNWLNDPKFIGEYEPFTPTTQRRLERTYDKLEGEQWWLIDEDHGRKGILINRLKDGHQEIKFFIDPEERRNGYATEAVTLIVDHLFLNHDIIRIQAETHPENTPAHKVLEKNGFTREATIRKNTFSGGIWRDSTIFSLLREEWTGPHYKW